MFYQFRRPSQYYRSLIPLTDDLESTGAVPQNSANISSVTSVDLEIVSRQSRLDMVFYNHFYTL